MKENRQGAGSVLLKKNHYGGNIYDKLDKVLGFAKSRTVLDVGCVGQAAGYSSDDWIHNKVKSVAKSILGVDIDIAGLDALKSKGYNVIHFDEMKNTSEKFEVILMLDVIEHVDNPVEFLSEYAEFLSEDGLMVVTTPNSHRSIDVINILINNTYGVNKEHTAWFCPKVFLEIVRRVGLLEVDNIFWLTHHYKLPNTTRFTVRLKFLIDKMLWRFRNEYSPNFMVVLKRKNQGSCRDS